MDTADYASDRAGSLMLVDGRYTAFVPRPLPPTIKYTPSLVSCLSEADQALGGINQLGAFIPNPRLMIAPMINLEAVSSSRIEGTVTTIDEVFRAQVNAPEAETEPMREVLNYLHALEAGTAAVRGKTLSLELAKSLHRQLLKGVRGDSKRPGEFRNIQVYVGSSYVPPPADLLGDLLANWEKFVQKATVSSALVQCAIMHAQFEMIHPFIDGNGRVGRLLMALLLISRGSLNEPLLFLSPYFERHRGQYYRRLLAISQEGDWEGWIGFFCEAVTAQARYGIRTARNLTQLRDEFRRSVSQQTSSALAIKAVDLLFEHPYLNAKTVAGRLGMSAPGSRKMLSRLESLGIVRETTGRSRGRVYGADRILDLIRSASDPESQRLESLTTEDLQQ